MPTQTIAGALIGGALGAYGKKPKIPELPRLDTAKIQQEATAGNIAALPGLQELSSAVNRFTFSEISQMFERTLPGFMASLARSTESAGALARGEVPEDVSGFVRRAGAARALGGGTAGSAFARNLTLRDLGLTSLQATGEGQNRLLGLGTFSRQAFPQFDFTTAFISPQQKMTFDYQQNIDQWRRNLLAAQVKAAPDPNMVALAGAIDNFFETAKNIGLSYAGGAGMPVMK